MMKQVLIKAFHQYLDGEEVEARTEASEALHPGDKVLAFKDSISATSDVSVPRSSQHSAIGIEGIVVDVQTMENNRGLKLRVRKL